MEKQQIRAVGTFSYAGTAEGLRHLSEAAAETGGEVNLAQPGTAKVNYVARVDGGWPIGEPDFPRFDFATAINIGIDGGIRTPHYHTSEGIVFLEPEQFAEMVYAKAMVVAKEAREWAKAGTVDMQIVDGMNAILEMTETPIG